MEKYIQVYRCSGCKGNKFVLSDSLDFLPVEERRHVSAVVKQGAVLQMEGFSHCGIYTPLALYTLSEPVQNV